MAPQNPRHTDVTNVATRTRWIQDANSEGAALSGAEAPAADARRRLPAPVSALALEAVPAAATATTSAVNALEAVAIVVPAAVVAEAGRESKELPGGAGVFSRSSSGPLETAP
mmetsp:Transcript_62835/g.118155  ORF Transcript_62835/g.118155 Transcript_62835/m.118155 type:complete len:113 (+) Transcript_62835:543-881(+)